MLKKDSIENFYRDDAYLGFDGVFNLEKYTPYVDFVKKHIGTKNITELGSGLGAAACALYQSGVKVVASDIYPKNALEKFKELKLNIQVLEANINQMPWAPKSVENFCMNEVLEHLENPRQAFLECHRCLVTGGKLVIVSPNLLSPLSSGLAFVQSITGRWKTPLYKRTDGYTFPLGGTLLEIIGIGLRNLWVSIKMYFFKTKRQPLFREPSFQKPALSDSDAVFLCSPLSVKQLLEEVGFKIVSFQETRKSGVFAGSLWIVAQKT